MRKVFEQDTWHPKRDSVSVSVVFVEEPRVEGSYVRKRITAMISGVVLALVLLVPGAQAAQVGFVIANGVCVELANGSLPIPGNTNGQGKAVGLHQAHDVSPAIYGSLTACQAAL